MRKIRSSLLAFFLLFIICIDNTVAQTLDQKIKTIVQISGQPTALRNWLLTTYLNPVAYFSDAKEAPAYSNIERQTSEEEISKKLIAVLKANFTAAEISDIYLFALSKSGSKYLSKSKELSALYKEAFEPLILEINQLQAANANTKPSSPVYHTDKPDGFYLVINHDAARSTIENYKLEEYASIPITAILTARDSVLKEQFNRHVIMIELTPEGAIKFEKLTAENIGKPLAIVVDNVILTAPIIYAAIPGGKVQLSGDFSAAAAKRIVEKLNNQHKK